MLTLVTGPPSVGKTTFCRNSGKRWIDIDHWARRRFMLQKVPAINRFWENHSYWWTEFAEEIIDQQVELVADCLATAEGRKIYTETFGAVNLVYLWDRLDVLLKRNKERNDPIPESALLDKYFSFEKPTLKEGFVSTYIKKMPDGGVVAIGDETTLKAMGGTYDLLLSDEEWERRGSCVRLDKNGNFFFGWTEEELYEQRAAMVRARRDHKFLRVDRISPIRWDMMSEKEKQVWRQYRQDLLDITKKEGFPWDGENVPWPKKPDAREE